MNNLVLNWGNFLYFPEDKSTYLPAAIELILLIIVCVLIFKWLRKNSMKQAAEAKKLEERALEERDERMKKEQEEAKKLEERALEERDERMKEEQEKEND